MSHAPVLAGRSTPKPLLVRCLLWSDHGPTTPWSDDVPYVAPSSHGTRDARYVEFVARLGTPACRDRLRRFQEMALARRAELLALASPVEFEVFGLERALEFAIVELPFAFWQYARFNSCAAIPGPEAGADEILGFLEEAGGLYALADSALAAFAPYYFQAATELGGPRFDERGMRTLLQYSREGVPAAYPPLEVEKDFDAAIMQQVEHWVQRAGIRMLFIYGEEDPWSAGAFAVSEANDSYLLFAPAGDHLSSISELPDVARDFALGKLSQWLGDATLGAVRRGATKPTQPIHRPNKAELFLR